MKELSEEIQNKNILIIDDAASMRGLLAAILKGFGLSRIYEAVDGNAGLQVLQKRKIDLIFCDWEMPKKDGLQLFLDLQKDDALKQVPFILVTSMAELEKVKTAMQSGIKDYIVKPFKQETILIKIDDIFG